METRWVQKEIFYQIHQEFTEGVSSQERERVDINAKELLGF